MATMLKEMSWREAKDFIEGRLNRLAMCKRGTLDTDINAMRKALGDRPEYTAEEKQKIRESLADALMKKGRLTRTIIKKCNYNPANIASELAKKMGEVIKNQFIHPDTAKWHDAHSLINQQHKEREAQLDGDFRDCLDDFILGTKEISEFPAVYAEMEAREW